MTSGKIPKNERKPTNYRTRIIVLGFLILVFCGAVLLNLPVASRDGQAVGFINALFTATSAVCVTGLTVVNTLEHWTIFGQLVILSLIQIGGLGLMTVLTMFMVITRRRIMYDARVLLQESLNQDANKGIIIFLKRIVAGTVLFEGLGALILSLRFIPDYGVRRGIYMGVFHAISAFCNAGFDIMGQNSLAPYVTDPTVNLVIMLLIIIGGLGFTVWMDCFHLFRDNHEIPFRTRVSRLHLHTKIVLTVTPCLILIGFLVFLAAEYHNPATLGALPLSGKLWAAVFQSVTTRTAGYFTISQGDLSYASKFMSIVLMFIGGSPVGTAGGIKTVTLGVLISAVTSVVRGQQHTTAYHKTLSFDTLQKALTVFLISIVSVVAITMLLTITESGLRGQFEFIDLLFETASATGTVGLSAGLTPLLSSAGKLLLSLGMFAGRLGPVTIVIALAKQQAKAGVSIEYAEENVIIG